jgi:hypothetical protein
MTAHFRLVLTLPQCVGRRLAAYQEWASEARRTTGAEPIGGLSMNRSAVITVQSGPRSDVYFLAGAIDRLRLIGLIGIATGGGDALPLGAIQVEADPSPSYVHDADFFAFAFDV